MLNDLIAFLFFCFFTAVILYLSYGLKHYEINKRECHDLIETKTTKKIWFGLLGSMTTYTYEEPPENCTSCGDIIVVGCDCCEQCSECCDCFDWYT